jgi:hypothetical protein
MHQKQQPRQPVVCILAIKPVMVESRVIVGANMFLLERLPFCDAVLFLYCSHARPLLVQGSFCYMMTVQPGYYYRASSVHVTVC